MKAKILSYLFEKHILSPTASRLAKELGETDKKLLYGKWEGRNVRPETIHTLWDKIIYTFNISEYTLEHLPNLWELSEQMADRLQINDFINLCLSKVSRIEDEELRASLRALKKASMVDYCYVLALFYAKVSGYDVNASKGSDVLIEVLQQVDALLHRRYPEGAVAHALAQEYIHKARKIKLLGWTMLMNFVGYLIAYYTHPHFIDQMQAEEFPPLDLDETTWWKTEDGELCLWRLTRVSENNALYSVLVVNPQDNQTITKEICKLYLIGFQKHYQCLQLHKIEQGKKLSVSYFHYAFDENKLQLDLEPNRELAGKEPLVMHKTLRRIDEDALAKYGIPTHVQELLDEIESELNLTQQGIEETDMKVVDVTMTRNSCTLHIQQSNNGIKNIHLNISENSTLRDINVWDNVYILRDNADGRYYAFWETLNIRVPLP